MTDYVVQGIDGELKPSVIETEFLILLPDGNWYCNAHDQARLGSAMHGDALGQPANYYKNLGDAIDVVGWLMQRAGQVGAVEYRPVIYQRKKHIVWTTPVPDEHGETMLGDTPIVTVDGDSQ